MTGAHWITCRTISLGSEVAGLAMHPSGETLYTSHGHGVRVWKIAPDGGMEALPGVEGINVSRLHVMPDGEKFIGLEPAMRSWG